MTIHRAIIEQRPPVWRVTCTGCDRRIVCETLGQAEIEGQTHFWRETK